VPVPATPVPGAPGVSRVAVPSPTLPPATTTNCWLLGHDAVIAVDPAGVRPEAQRGLAEALRPRRVAAIFLTHHHVDHVGGVQDLRARTGAPVWAHAHTAAHVPFPVDRLLDEGDELVTDAGTWTALYTPGHARGHLCLRSEDGGSIVAGDMVAGEGTIVLDPPEGALGDYLDSLARLLALEPVRLLPAHGEVIEPAGSLLQHYIEHRQARTDQILRALQAARASAPIGLVPMVYPDLPLPFHPVAARQVLCHLQWLAARGDALAIGDTFHASGGTP
jgi:endoribonuclease LACTB2